MNIQSPKVFNPSLVTRKPLTTEELAEHFSVTTRTIANWRDAGKIPFIRITARCFRYDLDQVQRALANQNADL